MVSKIMDNRSSMKKNKVFSYAYVIFAYVIAIYGGKLSLEYVQTTSHLLDMLVADVIATGIIFVFSLGVQNSSLYDPYWSFIPVPIALYWMYLFPEGNQTRQILILVVILIWSLRLTINWIRSWPDLSHEDWRYRKLAKDSGGLYWLVSFFGIHLFPTGIVFAGLLPVFIAVQTPDPIGTFDIIGLILCLGAVDIEYLADEQLRKFKLSNSTKGANMESGLWSVSRHPNYLGEIMFWIGLFFFVIEGQFIEHLWTAIGFILMILLFYFISVPMMERRLVQTKSGYGKYQKKVPAIFPLKLKKKSV
jgi:steroid 5-alpha reductase family enzyme